MMAEIEVPRLVERHEVDVDMWNVDANHCLADFDAGADLLKSFGDATCKEVQLGEEFLVEIENIVHFLFGYAEDVSRDDRIDVEEGEAMLRLGHFIAGNFTCNDLAENGHIEWDFSVRS